MTLSVTMFHPGVSALDFDDVTTSRYQQDHVVMDLTSDDSDHKNASKDDSIG